MALTVLTALIPIDTTMTNINNWIAGTTINTIFTVDLTEIGGQAYAMIMYN
jgi:hypothetical protein